MVGTRAGLAHIVPAPSALAANAHSGEQSLRVAASCGRPAPHAWLAREEFQELDSDQPIPDMEMLAATREQHAAQRPAARAQA